ncbi:MAG: hypothetical protein ACAH80_14640 [Alphaproteobacteria bacterium]
MKHFMIIACLALLPFPALAEIKQSMTVDEAYKAIPHQKTKFDSLKGSMSGDEKAFLDVFFELVDLAMVERVSSMQAISSGKAVSANYDEIDRRLMSIEVPEKLKTAHMLVTQAVQEQRKYLEQWKNSGGAFNVGDPLIGSSSAKLVQAYGELMRIYPQESEHNKKAFFDHLCALDFK